MRGWGGGNLPELGLACKYGCHSLPAVLPGICRLAWSQDDSFTMKSSCAANSSEAIKLPLVHRGLRLLMDGYETRIRISKV